MYSYTREMYNRIVLPPLKTLSKFRYFLIYFIPPVSHPPLLADLYSRQLLLILIAYWVSIARKFHRPHCEHVSSTFNTLQILVNSSITIIMYACFFYFRSSNRGGKWFGITGNYSIGYGTIFMYCFQWYSFPCL